MIPANRSSTSSTSRSFFYNLAYSPVARFFSKSMESKAEFYECLSACFATRPINFREPETLAILVFILDAFKANVPLSPEMTNLYFSIPTMQTQHSFPTLYNMGLERPLALEGGRSTGKWPWDFDPNALAKGCAIEMEHTIDPMVAMVIAMDHLQEHPAYYDGLELMELRWQRKAHLSEVDLVVRVNECFRIPVPSIPDEMFALQPVGRAIDGSTIRLQWIHDLFGVLDTENSPIEMMSARGSGEPRCFRVVHSPAIRSPTDLRFRAIREGFCMLQFRLSRQGWNSIPVAEKLYRIYVANPLDVRFTHLAT